MITKNLFRLQMCITVIFILMNSAFSQTYLFEFNNVEKINEKVIEFDIVLSAPIDTFILDSYQTSLQYSKEFLNSGEVTFSYLNGSSQIKNHPMYGIGKSTEGEIEKFTFASNPSGNDTITNSYKKIGRFRIENSNSFLNVPFNISWCFDGKINTIITSTNSTNVTNPENHKDLEIENLITGIEGPEHPKSFELHQNYPNPFNPSTTIRYSVPSESKVNIKIFNILGELVDELIRNEIQIGMQSIHWDAAKLSSGTYILSMEAVALATKQPYKSNKKMILLK
jgi:hypothetical protein